MDTPIFRNVDSVCVCVCVSECMCVAVWIDDISLCSIRDLSVVILIFSVKYQNYSYRVNVCCSIFGHTSLWVHAYYVLFLPRIE